MKFDENNFLIKLEEFENQLYEYEAKYGKHPIICCTKYTHDFLFSLMMKNRKNYNDFSTKATYDINNDFVEKCFYKRWEFKFEKSIPDNEIYIKEEYYEDSTSNFFGQFVEIPTPTFNLTYTSPFLFTNTLLSPARPIISPYTISYLRGNIND